MESFLLEHLSGPVLAIVIVGITTALSVGGLLLVRRRVDRSTLEANQEVAGYILAVVGAVYAVLLAFVVISVWEQFEEAKADATNEATAVGLLYRDALILHERDAAARQAVQRYAESVAGPEWHEMAAHQREHRETDAALNAVWREFRATPPPEGSDAAFHDQAIDRLHEATELRRKRILTSGNQLPAPLWIVLIAGAAISVGFTYFFGVGSRGAQVLMVSALASTIGLVLFLTLSLDLPFTGDVAVEPSAMEDVIDEFPHYAD